MGGGGSSGPSQREIYAAQEKAEKAEQERLAKERADAIAKANEGASNGVSSGGEGTKEGALTAARKTKKGATLAGEGRQTFGGNSNLGG